MDSRIQNAAVTAMTLAISALTLAASSKWPGRIGPRKLQGRSAPSSRAKPNWNRRRPTIDREARAAVRTGPRADLTLLPANLCGVSFIRGHYRYPPPIRMKNAAEWKDLRQAVSPAS